MWWWYGQAQLIRAMTWQALVVKAAKYASMGWTIVLGYRCSIAMLHWFVAHHHEPPEVSAIFGYAKGPIGSLALAGLGVYIDRNSSKYSKVACEHFLDKHNWKGVYNALDIESRQHACRVDQFDGMAGWTNPALNTRLLLRSGSHGKPLEYLASKAPRFAYDSKDPGQKSVRSIIRRYVIQEAMSKRRIIFNRDKIRLCGDLDVSLSESVQLQRTDYISSMMTDGLAFKSLYLRAEHTEISDGWSSFLEQVNGHRRLKSLASCSTSNQLGTSTLAFSSDGFLVLLDQTERNQHSAGMISPSGSGSLDWSDLDDHLQGDFFQLIKRSAARELLEETGLNRLPDFVDRKSLAENSMVIFAFTRLIHRGGKPEFFCLARLPKTMDEIRSVVPRFLERRYSEHTFSHDASAINKKASFEAEIRRVCRYYSDPTRIFSNAERIRRYRLSYQLMHGLSLLEDCLSEPDSVAVLKALLT